MRHIGTASAVVLAVLLGGWTVMLAQVYVPPSDSAHHVHPTGGLDVPILTPGPGWKTCGRCENAAHIKEAREKAQVDTHAFDPHDLSGVWGNNGIELDLKALPPFTPYGEKLYDATKSDTIENTKDPMNGCDPLGYPRAFAYNYGTEFVQLPGRVLEFFEFQHTWRTIWTDGRKLPADPPVDRYLGYSVGRWEADTFIVESSGFDDRSWVSEDRRNRHHGFPHTSDMKVIERYKRLNYGLLEATLSVIDPKVYTQPWTTTGKIQLLPNAELAEYFCVPSESNFFDNLQTNPSATGVPTK